MDTQTENKAFERKLADGSWEDVSGVASLIAAAVRFTGRTEEKVIDELAEGTQIPTGSDWYERFRIKPISRPSRPVVTVFCDCGCKCSRNEVMSASMGTSCPNCYDHMSD